MAALQKQILQAFKNAGLSDNQARIMTAEVGRENSYNPDTVFGVHTDDSNGKKNVGLLSWQNGRETPLLRSLSQNGLLKNGQISKDQKSLDLMARYAVNEINTKPEYKRTKETFLNNPDIGYKEGAEVLGNNFIKWRYTDPAYASGHKNRDDFYRQLGGKVDTANVARERHENRSASIVAAYRAKNKEPVKPTAEQTAAQRQARTSSIVSAYKAAQQKGTVPNSAANTGLPDFDQNGVINYAQVPQEQKPPERTLTDGLKGAGEAALTTLTGATTGALGMVGGTAAQAGREILGGNFGTPEAANRISQNAAESASDFTYAPRTTAGQEYVQNIGEVAEPLVALTPALSEIALAGQAARGASQISRAQAAQVGQVITPIVEQAGQAISKPIRAATQGIQTGVDNLKNIVGLGASPDTSPAPNHMGAAGVDQSTVRQALAQDLPYPPQLTQGQISRNPSQLKFEVETSKNADLGAPIRQRYEEQHLNLQQNLDEFIDMTGSQSTNMRDTGIAVDKALQKQMQADKNRVRVAYAKADKSDEAQQTVDLTNPVNNGNESLTILDYLNSQPDLKSTPILTDAKNIALEMGIARKDSSGKLTPIAPTVKQMEKWRSEINQNTNHEATNIRQATILKSMIDQHVEPVAGKLYKAARTERKAMARKWENRKIITDLTTDKRGSDDRKVALEDIQKRIIYDGSLDDLRFAKRALLTSGDEGKQAWKDIQGQTLQEIKTAATVGVSPDGQGNQMVSPAALNRAINRLDTDGKLDFVFGKDGAEKLRAINDISKTMFTVPSSAAINHSNTAATLAAAMDIVMSGFSGFPAPVATALRLATKRIKDSKVRNRVNQALNIGATNEQ